MRLIALLLIGCLLLTSIGYHVAFRMQMGQLKAAMKRSLRQNRNRKEVLELTFDQETAQQLHWIEEQEFSWKGELYDVIEKHEQRDQVVIVCIADKQEEKLLKEYQKNTQQNQNRTGLTWIKLMTSQFVLMAGSWPQIFSIEIENRFKQVVDPVTFRPLTIFSPPPDVC